MSYYIVVTIKEDSMQVEQVRAAILSAPKGANIVVEWNRTLKPLKTSGCSDTIVKSTRMVGRIGIDYDNIQTVKDKRESGELPAENAGLKGMIWIEPPYLLQSEKSGRLLLRLYNGTSKTIKPEVHFFRNGVEVERNSLQGIVPSKDWQTADKKGDCFCCHIDDMTRIHAESEWIMLVVGQVGSQKIVTETPVPAKVLATIQ